MIDHAEVKAFTDTLREAVRYAKTNPDEARRLAFKATKIVMSLDWSRLYGNIVVGASLIRSNPDVFVGYCLGAAVEIENWLAKMQGSEDT